MATIKSEWHGPKRKQELEAELTRRLEAAARVVANEAKQSVSVAGTGQSRDTKTGKFRRKYGANPSAPGEPPHKQTGRLRAAITQEITRSVFGKLIARVGTNLLYGRWLELGTSKMAARPWLRRALNAKAAVVKAILGKPMN